LGKVLSIINVKGGVGKSTVTMMLAEVLAVVHGKRVLVVDSDPQTSLSLMLADKERILEVEKDKKTILDFILKATPKNRQKTLAAMVMTPVSDVVGAHSLHLLPGNYRLFYVERVAGKMPTKKKLYDRIQHLAEAAREQFDIILIDCPPGYSELSDAWLLHSDYYLTPVAPNFLSTRALSVLRKISAVGRQWQSTGDESGCAYQL
jgi:chromosome partitioning protein